MNAAIEQLLEVEDKLKENVVERSTMAVGLARVGQMTQKIVYGTLEELLSVDFGTPLHSLVICGEVHPLEEDVSTIFNP